MMKLSHQLFFLLVFSLMCFSCKKGPKIISVPVSAETNDDSGSTGIFSEGGDLEIPKATAPVTSDVHTVKVLEVLPTDKYVYLRVSEKEDEFWIATGKKEIIVGETYFYKNGILKTNFESKEYNRIFDKVYLVSNIVSIDHGGANSTVPKTQTTSSAEVTAKNIEVEGSIKISEIVNNPEKYNGKSVQISGICFKVNPNIMGRNWMHLKDGSKDDYDFVITSDVAVPEGHVVTMSGIVVLDKDFGAGYKYDIIIENGKLIRSN